jgi:uncharacterized CHY-type Zn-finger protein
VRIHGVEVKGKLKDEHTRCDHYHTEKDIIAIKFPCCSVYYPCFQCHDETADHPAEAWEASAFSEKAVLCGNCGHRLAIHEYLRSGYQCPECGADFNPGCGNHSHLYFQR